MQTSRGDWTKLNQTLPRFYDRLNKFVNRAQNNADWSELTLAEKLASLRLGWTGVGCVVDDIRTLQFQRVDGVLNKLRNIERHVAEHVKQ
jgi:hypothetical protein